MPISIKKDEKYLLFNLKRKNVIQNQKFWKTVIPMISNKLVRSEKLTMVEMKRLILMTKRQQSF